VLPKHRLLSTASSGTITNDREGQECPLRFRILGCGDGRPGNWLGSSSPMDYDQEGPSWAVKADQREKRGTDERVDWNSEGDDHEPTTLATRIRGPCPVPRSRTGARRSPGHLLHRADHAGDDFPGTEWFRKPWRQLPGPGCRGPNHLGVARCRGNSQRLRKRLALEPSRRAVPADVGLGSVERRVPGRGRKPERKPHREEARWATWRRLTGTGTWSPRSAPTSD
jgi:hypothetical protein